MKIYIISDTHKKFPDQKLENLFKNEFKNADLILHAGDLTEPDFLSFLEQYNTMAVLGNSDSPKLQGLLPLKRTFKFGKITLGLAHGWGHYSEAAQNARSLFTEDINILIHGHTHMQKATWVNNNKELWLCPGATGDNYRDALGSGFLKLTINQDNIWNPENINFELNRF